jgi:hypothetical protein
VRFKFQLLIDVEASCSYETPLSFTTKRKDRSTMIVNRIEDLLSQLSDERGIVTIKVRRVSD